jgi:hypothetical protein
MSRLREIYSGRFLRGPDLNNQARTASIAHAYIESLPAFGGGGETTEKLILSLNETTKEVACNKPSAEVLMAQWGDDERAFIGKRITLYSVAMNVKGTMREVLMVKPAAPPARAAAQSWPAQGPAPRGGAPRSVNALPLAQDEAPPMEDAPPFDDEIPM